MNILGEEFTRYDLGCVALVLVIGGAILTGASLGLVWLFGGL